MNKKAKIYYFSLTDEMRKEDKLDWFQNTNIQNIPFELITPDKKNNWLNITDNDFEDLIPLIDYEVKKGKKQSAIFKLFNNGSATNRDEWVYDISSDNLKKKMGHFVERFNFLQDKNDKTFPTDIKWSHSLKNKFRSGEKLKFKSDMLCKSFYRPFHKIFYYSDLRTSDLLTEYHFEMFGKGLNSTNNVIWFKCGREWDFFALAINHVHDILPQGGSKSLPLYRYNSEGQKIENITDWALDLFRNHYVVDTHRSAYLRGADLQKTDIFHYIYGVLHNPVYRKKYEQNLKRDFPRIPLYDDFWFWAEKGKALMDLHLNYDSPSPLASKGRTEKTKGGEAPLIRKDKAPSSKGKKSKVPPLGARGLKPKLKADKEQGIIYLDQMTSLEGVPSLAWEYKLGNRSALEWVLDQYKEKKPRDKTIAEKFNTYRFADYKEEVIDLLEKVCTVSVRTMEIIKEMEKQ